MVKDADIHYGRPPLIETALSVQFAEVPDLRNAHLGEFWAAFKDRYPQVDDAVRLDPQFETFGETLPSSGSGLPSFRIASGALARLRMVSEDGVRMVQVQNGRLVVNWLKRGESEYPRFGATAEEFARAFSGFSTYLNSKGWQPAWNQWEVTYVNRIPKGEAWQGRNEWPKLLPGLLGSGQGASGTALESVNCDWHYEILPRLGRLHIELTHGRMGPAIDADEALMLLLTARGPLAPSSGLREVREGLTCGHDAIVRTFDAVIGESARRLWKRI